MKTADEVKAKVLEMGGWFVGDRICFSSIDAHEAFKAWRWKSV